MLSARGGRRRSKRKEIARRRMDSAARLPLSRSDDAEQPQDQDQDKDTAKTDIHDISPLLVLLLKR